MPVRIAVFDDAPIFLEFISNVISDVPDFDLTGAFTDCTNMQEKLLQAKPDVVVMDIEMPHINGIEGLRLIKQLSPGISVIMQTSHEEDEWIFNAVCAGASGYILKNQSAEEVISSIRSAYQGGAPLSPAIAKRVLHLLQRGNNTPDTNTPDYSLSDREKEVLSFLVQGMSFKMIAESCFISYETVRSHMKKIYAKLHVASNTEAVSKALREGLV